MKVWISAALLACAFAAMGCEQKGADAPKQGAAAATATSTAKAAPAKTAAPAGGGW